MNPPLSEIDYAALRPAPLFVHAPRHETRHCVRKHAYPTKRDAHTARNAALNRRQHRPETLRAYPCPVCRAWHLTHKPLVTN